MKTPYRKAFSLIELLTAISIIGIVAAISYPVFTRVKVAALESKSKSQMRQIHLETLLYQGDNSGDGVYSDSHSMGLPDVPSKSIKTFDLLRPPFAPHPLSRFLGSNYIVLWLPPDQDTLTPSWASYASSAQDKSVLALDPFNNDRNVPLNDGHYYVRKIFSIRWHGGLVVTHTTGDWDERSFWMLER